MTILPRNTSREPRGGPPSRGFTLIELIVVMTIIGILITLILIASRDGIRQAEARATQALILKIASGVDDRLDALMQLRPDANFTHGYLSGVYYGGTEADGGPLMSPRAILPTGYPDTKVRTTSRARAIALMDYLKSEMPDVFFVRLGNPASNQYPLNFGAQPFPGDPAFSDLGDHANYVLPIGHMVQGPRGVASETNWVSGYGDSNIQSGILYSSNPQLGFAGRGIYGASYAVAAGIYKQLGYLPNGYDLVDNNGNGLIDEWAEGVDATNEADVLARLGQHTHETARSEMLYALLVEGQGPLGSIFNPDDFSDREVRDTDGDGLMEFVDAWGKPLQFYRWPLFYHSETQRGVNVGADLTDSTAPLEFLRPYASVYETREQDPLDPNQTLMAPDWWLAAQNAGFPSVLAPGATLPGTPVNSSLGVAAFERYFHRLTEPMQVTGSTTELGRYWDRGGYAGLGYRRAYGGKPLILSGGPDQQAGVFAFTDLSSAGSDAEIAAGLLGIENNAPRFVPDEVMTGGLIPGTNFTINPTWKTFQLWDAGQDDVTNHNVAAAASGSGG